MILVTRRRSTYQRECGDKHAHSSLGAARRHANRFDGMNPYRCSFCGSWHVGHPRASVLDAPTKPDAQRERRAWRRLRRRWMKKYAGKRRAGEAM